MNYYEENAERFKVKTVPITKSGWSREYWLEGDPNFVMLEVARQLKEDSYTQMYEHMRLQVVDVEYVTPKGSPEPFRNVKILRVRMYKNLYAGD